MVLALAGDSTMTSDDPPPLSEPLSISVTSFFFARFAAGFRAAISVHRFLCLVCGHRQSGALDQGAKVIQGYPAVYLYQSPLDQLLQLRRRHGARPRKSQ